MREDRQDNRLPKVRKEMTDKIMNEINRVVRMVDDVADTKVFFAGVRKRIRRILNGK